MAFWLVTYGHISASRQTNEVFETVRRCVCVCGSLTVCTVTGNVPYFFFNLTYREVTSCSGRSPHFPPFTLPFLSFISFYLLNITSAVLFHSVTPESTSLVILTHIISLLHPIAPSFLQPSFTYRWYESLESAVFYFPPPKKSVARKNLARTKVGQTLINSRLSWAAWHHSDLKCILFEEMQDDHLSNTFTSQLTNSTIRAK